MPQLDKLIILTQYKVFLFLFLMVYFIFLLLILPKLNLTLRLRKAKFRNLLALNYGLRSRSIFSFFSSKEYFLNCFSSIEHLGFARLSSILKDRLSISFLKLDSILRKIL